MEKIVAVAGEVTAEQTRVVAVLAMVRKRMKQTAVTAAQASSSSDTQSNTDPTQRGLVHIHHDIR
jgi:hypothetical protein